MHDSGKGLAYGYSVRCMNIEALTLVTHASIIVRTMSFITAIPKFTSLSYREQ